MTEEPVLVYGEAKIALDEAEEAWKKTLENVFATKSEASEERRSGDKAVPDGQGTYLQSQDWPADRIYSGISGYKL